jgi:hypothetical protein
MNNDEYILDLFHKSNTVYGNLTPLQNNLFYTISSESIFLSSIKSLNSNIAKPRITDEISSLSTSAVNSVDIDVSGSNPYYWIVNINYSDPGIIATNRLGTALTVDVSGNVNSAVLGEYVVEYIIKSASNYVMTRYFRTVHVVDTVSPVITILGSNPLNLEVYSDLTGVEFGATATDNFDSSVSVSSVSNLDISNTGTYQIVYSASDTNDNDASAVRIINVVDTTLPVISLIGENPLVHSMLTSYIDPGINSSDNYDVSLTVTIETDLNANIVGEYYYKYNVVDDYDNSRNVTRTVYVLDFTLMNNIPVITISGDVSYNVSKLMNMVDSTDYFNNNALLLSDEFSINFAQRNETYRIPVFDGLYNISSMPNNIVVLMYGFSGEQISIISTDMNNTSNKFPYITDSATDLSFTNLVNLVIHQNNNYKFVILNGRSSDLLDFRDPTLSIVGSNPYQHEANTAFVDPSATAVDYKETSMSVSAYNNINTALIGAYEVLYVATDASGYQTIKNRIVNVQDTTPPVITISGDNPLNLTVGNTYVEYGASAVDTYDGSLTVNIVSNNVNTSVDGSYQVVYDVSDSTGNDASAVRYVNVNPLLQLSNLINNPGVVDYQIPKYYTLAPPNLSYSMGPEYYKAYCVPTSFASVLNYYNEVQGLNIQLNYTSLNSMAPETDYMFNFNNRPQGVTGVTDPTKIDLGYYFNTNAQGFDLSSGSHVGTMLKDFSKFVDFMTVVSPSAQYHYYYKGLNNGIAYTNISGATGAQYSANDISTNVILSDICANISAAKPVILSFLHWNIVDSGATVSVDGTPINLYDLSGYSPAPDAELTIYNSNPELIEEVWNNENSEINVGHTVVCVGFIENYNGKNWIIVQDNVSQPNDPNLTHRYVGIELDYTVLIMCTFIDFAPQRGNPINNIAVSSNISPLPNGFGSSLRIYNSGTTSLIDISQQFIINDNQDLDDISNNVALYTVNDGLYIECASGNIYDGQKLVSIMVDVCLNTIKQSAVTDFSFVLSTDLSDNYHLVNAADPTLEYLFITSTATDYSVDSNFTDLSNGPLLLGTFSF